ncbi:alpha/beta hydrolase [Halogeometricum pallidum JCM 14848]|uniref:Alpha/beta hydrolase n=1 Tax=Halogeometricum pallidum JCM 14848 TaxID=1227487 RepID=M0DBB1_HALPD|nr:dienelactone hydrolase family protein [Halogeometricum pallidum]ELZ32790.1 alpha/beta hydrolase [Halogeometricum pallidum JCM 14848]
MSETILVPGGRDVRGTLETADSNADSTAAVVACPPHPQQGGHRGDERLVAVADELTDRGVDCLRFDYGPWDEGRGEREDAARAVEWVTERYDRAGLFGFSFGGAVALLTAADGADVEAVSALAPASGLPDGSDAVAAFEEIPVPVQVVYGTRDDVADAAAVADRAREFEQSVVELEADHFFVGQAGKVADRVAEFLVPWVRPEASP